jgi:hypothetical protein
MQEEVQIQNAILKNESIPWSHLQEISVPFLAIFRLRKREGVL